MRASARLLATGLHQVDNPVFGADGHLYVTYSGTRGQEATVSIFRITGNGAREPFVHGARQSDVDGGRSRRLAVCVEPLRRPRLSRVRRWAVRGDGVGSGRGVRAGVRRGRRAVRRRSRRHASSGSIAGGRTETFATIPSSIAAFHLAMSPDGDLYVSAPTLASYDSVRRIDPDGRVEALNIPFGRPQGLAFDAQRRAACRRSARRIERRLCDPARSRTGAGRGRRRTGRPGVRARTARWSSPPAIRSIPSRRRHDRRRRRRAAGAGSGVARPSHDVGADAARASAASRWLVSIIIGAILVMATLQISDQLPTSTTSGWDCWCRCRRSASSISRSGGSDGGRVRRIRTIDHQEARQLLAAGDGDGPRCAHARRIRAARSYSRRVVVAGRSRRRPRRRCCPTTSKPVLVYCEHGVRSRRGVAVAGRRPASATC